MLQCLQEYFLDIPASSSVQLYLVWYNNMILKTQYIMCQRIIRNFTFRYMNSRYGVGHLTGNLFHSFKLSVNLPDGILTQIALSYFVTFAVIQHYHRLTKNVSPNYLKLLMDLQLTSGFSLDQLPSVSLVYALSW